MALQQKVIDGAENFPITLFTPKHYFIEYARLLARLTDWFKTSGSAWTPIDGQGRPSLVCVSGESSPVLGM